MQCVILAGGLGTRISAVAAGLPKALVPVDGRPFADLQLALLARGGVERVVYCVGHLAGAIQEYVGNGARWGLQVDYVDEGPALRGTAGALRLALDRGALEPSFLVLYGDSFLMIDYRAVWAAFQASGRPALMTVLRNEGRWDTSNVLFEEGQVVLYDKRRADPRSADMAFIDYGLTALERELVAAEVPADARADLADLYHRLSVSGRLAGHEVLQRFYEVGSPSGLEEFRALVAAGGVISSGS